MIAAFEKSGSGAAHDAGSEGKDNVLEFYGSDFVVTGAAGFERLIVPLARASVFEGSDVVSQETSEEAFLGGHGTVNGGGGSTGVGGHPCYVSADDQRVNLVRALVGEHRLQVHHMPENRMLEADAVGA